MLSLSLGETNMFFKVWPPLKCTSTPCFLQMFFTLSPMPCEYGTTIWLLAGNLLLGVCFFFFCWWFLKIFLIAHVGYLHCTSTFSRCCSSCSANSGVELMVSALCERVLITLYLAAMLWLLSHGRYRSVCVGFLYTHMVKVPSAYTCGEIDCNEEYIGESGRTFGERYKEHLKAPSPIFLHQNSSGHVTTLNNFKIIAREENSLARTIRNLYTLGSTTPP